MSDELISQLEKRRSDLIAANREVLAAASAGNRATTPDEDAKYSANMNEVRALAARMDDLRGEAEREQRAQQAREPGPADTGTGARATVQVTDEPTVYGKYSPNSYWLDLARAETGRGSDPQSARQRLSRHVQELDVEVPKRQERRAQLAKERVERMHTGSRREERALEAFYGNGMAMFEQRAINRTDGTGGYFVPPLWMIDEYVPYLRAGRVAADRCQSMPLPAGTDSINLPRISTGTANGSQTADGAALNARDMADNFVTAPVKTIAGQQDAAMQLLDQSPVAFDAVVFKDLLADYAMNLDGTVLLGSGSSGQFTGMYPQGTLTGGSTPGVIVNTMTATTNVWTNSTGGFYPSVGALVSQLSRNRFRPPNAIVSNPAVWYALSTASDSQNRPLVVPTQQGPVNTIAQYDAALSEGLAGTILGIPWYLDANVPLTFGSSGTAPSMGTLSSGNVAPTQGSGGTTPNLPVYTGVFAGVWDDLLLFEGEIRSRVLQEVLSGTLQVRFQVYNYVAFMPNRYQDGSSRIVSYGNANGAGVLATALSQGAGGGLVNF